MKTQWNLKLFYSSPKDPKIKKDLQAISHAIGIFEKKYTRNKNFLRDASSLKRALDEYEKTVSMLDAPKPLFYFWYTRQLNAQDTFAEAQFNQLVERLTKEQNRILFFELELGKISKKIQEKFLSSRMLEKYHYFLEKLFRNASHHLTAPEEKIINRTSLPSHTLWTQGMNKLLNKQTVLWKGKNLPLALAMNKVSELVTGDRRALHTAIMKTLENISDFAEAEINAICINKKINDELRGFSHAYSQTMLQYENEEKTILNLVETITKNFPLAHRFYKLKAKLLRLPKLQYADRSAKYGAIHKKFSLGDGIEIVRARFSILGKRYVKIFDTFLKNGHIDFYPKKGKTSGAFCSSGIASPTLVLLNHDHSARSLLTLAHEMGHAIHSELSKSQTPLYQHYSTATAETASTFFEQFVFDALIENLSDKEKIIALHDKINDRDVSTIFRQIACFNFEYDLHTHIREHGSLSKEKIATLLNQHMKTYLGPVFSLTPLDGYFFVCWSHLRSFFYVYSYAFGQLISNALYERYKKDPSYFSLIEQFLFAGGSKSPENIFHDLGIDISQKNFWQEGLKGFTSDLKKLEILLH